MYTVAIDQNDSVVLLKVTDTAPFRGMPNAVIEPDLRSLRGAHLHDLKIVRGKLVYKTEAERKDAIMSPNFKYKGFKKYQPQRVHIRYDHRTTAALVLLIFVMFGLAVYLK